MVFVEGDCRGDEALSEVEWVTALANEAVPIIGIVAHVPLERGPAAARLLERLGHRRLVVGVRRLLQHEPRSLLEDPGLVRGIRLLAGYGLTFDVCVTSDQLPAVTRLVSASPDTSFVLDHVAKPPVGEGGLNPWRQDLSRLAGYPNVACKLSGLATIAATGARPADVVPYLQHALSAFGPARCMFGSDWPVCLLNTTYEMWLDTVLEATDDFTAAERDDVLGETAMRVYGLAHPTKGEQSACSQSST
jgi:L-fuconolactonase